LQVFFENFFGGGEAAAEKKTFQKEWNVGRGKRATERNVEKALRTRRIFREKSILNFKTDFGSFFLFLMGFD